MIHSTGSAADETTVTGPRRTLSPAVEVKSQGSPIDATTARPTSVAGPEVTRSAGGRPGPDRSGERLDIEDLHLDGIGAGPLPASPLAPERRLDDRAIA